MSAPPIPRTPITAAPGRLAMTRLPSTTKPPWMRRKVSRSAPTPSRARVASAADTTAPVIPVRVQAPSLHPRTARPVATPRVVSCCSARTASPARTARGAASPRQASPPHSPTAPDPTRACGTPPSRRTAAANASGSASPLASSTETMRTSSGSGAGRGVRVAVRPDVAVTTALGSSASTKAPIDGQRAPRSLRSARSIAARSQFGTSSGSGSASSVTMRTSSPIGVGASNGVRLDTAWYRVAPSPHTSVRGSSSRVPVACSKDMYAGVPRSTLADVSRAASEGSKPSASPKSSTRTPPSRQRNTLPGLTSRCTSPARWATSRPRATAEPIRATSSGGSAPTRRMRASRSSPSSSSIA